MSMEIESPSCSNKDNKLPCSSDIKYSDAGCSDDENGMDIEDSDTDCGNDECIQKGKCITYDLKVPLTLASLIDGLHKIFAHDKINVEFVKEYMNMYKSNYREWKKFAKFDQHR